MAKRETLISTDSNFFKVLSYFTNGKKVADFLNGKRYRIDKETFSYRIINHWEEEGLIKDSRKEGKGWRRYSIMDLVWIYIIRELRQFGFPLEKIKQVKASLVMEKGKEYGLLEAYVALAIVHKTPSFLLVFNDGQIITATFQEIRDTLIYGELSNHIQININALLQKLFPEKNLKAKYTNEVELRPDELELLFLLRTENYESIRVKQKGGKIEHLEATESIEVETRLKEILKDGNYQNIELKQADGKIVCIKRTIKKKI